MIELIDYSDDMFDFILESNNINKPQVGYLHKERLELLLKQANYCKIAKLNGEAAGFLLCLPENKEYDLYATNDRESTEEAHGASNETQLGLGLDLLVSLNVVKGCRVKVDLHKLKS